MNHKIAIREAMRDAGVTQKQLGAMLGVNQQAISNVLNRDEVMLSTFVRIMDALGYELDIKKKSAGLCYHCDDPIPAGSGVADTNTGKRYHKSCLGERLVAHYGKPLEEIERIEGKEEW